MKRYKNWVTEVFMQHDFDTSFSGVSKEEVGEKCCIACKEVYQDKEKKILFSGTHLDTCSCHTPSEIEKCCCGEIEQLGDSRCELAGVSHGRTPCWIIETPPLEVKEGSKDIENGAWMNYSSSEISKFRDFLQGENLKQEAKIKRELVEGIEGMKKDMTTVFYDEDGYTRANAKGYNQAIDDIKKLLSE